VLSEVAVEPQRSSSRVARKRARGDYFASSTNEASAVAPGSAAADAAAAAQEAAAAPIAVSPSEFKVRAQLMFKLDADSPATSGRLPATHIVSKERVQFAWCRPPFAHSSGRVAHEPPGSRSRDCFFAYRLEPNLSPQPLTSYGRHWRRCEPTEQPLERGISRSCACSSRAAGGHQAADMGVARRQVGARRRFRAPSMRTR
jgi:hypothetical protein